MKQLKYLLFCIPFLWGACSYELEKKAAPNDLIPQDTFTMVLQEVMIVESYIKHQQSNVNTYNKLLPKAVVPIFDKYNVDSTRFTNSMNYYATHQKKMIEIYNQIQDSIILETADYPQDESEE